MEHIYADIISSEQNISSYPLDIIANLMTKCPNILSVSILNRHNNIYFDENNCNEIFDLVLIDNYNRKYLDKIKLSEICIIFIIEYYYIPNTYLTYFQNRNYDIIYSSEYRYNAIPYVKNPIKPVYNNLKIYVLKQKQN